MARRRGVRVLFASSEIAPFAKTGGLADVCEALPKALVALGVAPTIIMPFYRQAREQMGDLELIVEDLPVLAGDDGVTADVYRGRLTSDIPAYFVRRDEFYDRSFLYGTSKGDYFDNAQRFSFLSKAIIALSEVMSLRWDIIHCHDWQTALVPAYVKTVASDRPLFSGIRTVFTIHNLGYQGLFPATAFSSLGLPPRAFAMDGLEYWGGVNLLKGGIVFADAITTVSPTYAREIRTPEFGSGLDGVLQAHSGKLVGILNGVDYAAWDPRGDTYLKEPYTVDSLGGKVTCKKDLLETLGLSSDLVERPLIGMISRLAGQKGVDLVAAVIDRLMSSGAGLVVLGRGEANYERLLQQTASKYPDRMAVRIDFDESLAHKIEAGCDMYLMPSRYEPCGLNQMYSLRYGTIPIVRRTGGLADTVAEVNTKRGTGTGFTFAAYTPDALWGAIERAIKCFAQPDVWKDVVIRAMSADFSWSRSAREYVKLYRQVQKTG